MTQFNELLAKVPDAFIKDADIESPDETQLESDFANMSFAFLRDRAAKLMPYLLGFEIVEREEDGSKAIGIFGFKVGEDYYYAPSFFTNGQVRGMDLLFNKRTNMFVPLRESWINDIINRQAITLGDTLPNANQLRQDFENPDFDFVANPPNVKAGVDLQQTINDGFAAWNAMQHVMVEAMEKDAEFQEAFSCALARVKHEELPIQKLASMTGKPDIFGYGKYDGNFTVAEALVHTIETMPKFAEALLTFYPSVLDLANRLPPTGKRAEKTAAQLEVVTESRSGMTSDERRRLVRDGFTVLDRRGPGQKSEVFEMDYIKTYANPDRSGTYNVLLRNGSLVKAWVLEAVHGLNGLVVIHPTRYFYFTAEPGAVLVEGDPDVDGRTPYDAAGAVNRMQAGRRYILVNDQGKASGPFRVHGVISENRRRTQVDVSWDSYIQHRQKDGYRTNSTDTLHCGDGIGSDLPKYLQLAEHNGNLAQTGKHLVVPANWKALEIFDKYDYDGGEVPTYDTPEYKAYDEKRTAYRAAVEAFCPADMTDLKEILEKNALQDVRIETDGNEFHFWLNHFHEGPYGYKTATVRLVRDYGLGVDDAEAILVKAASNNKVRRMVKFAQGVGGMVPMPGPQPMSFDQYSGVPIEMPQQEELTGQSLGMPVADYSLMGAQGINMGGQSAQEAGMDPGAVDLSMQAAQAGQKKVFDHATIGGLAKLYDASAVIDSYLPELTKALDRVGRILFIFYWKNEEFAERYGNEDMGEMEDLLRGVFKSFGDLTLKLKQKSVNAEPGIEAAEAV